jgi:hypothetical protein
MESASLASFDVQRPEPVVADPEELRRRLYVGDLANFGKAYADGMAELRKGDRHDG